jgi:hypothetical protein
MDFVHAPHFLFINPDFFALARSLFEVGRDHKKELKIHVSILPPTHSTMACGAVLLSITSGRTPFGTSYPDADQRCRLEMQTKIVDGDM